MTKTYLVAGSNWTAQVEIENIENYELNSIQVEAATRAVEAKFGKRFDIEIYGHLPISLTDEQQEQDELHASLVKLMTDELEPNCGIGMLLCIMDNQGIVLEHNKDHEWYISSKTILENVGMPHLVEKFLLKYPDNKKNKSV